MLDANVGVSTAIVIYESIRTQRRADIGKNHCGVDVGDLYFVSVIGDKIVVIC